MKATFFRLSADSFCREVGPYGYIVNQTTKHDRVFDRSGQIFLREFTRCPRTTDEAIDSLMKNFIGVERPILASDFNDFLGYMVKHRFAVTSTSQEDLDRQDFGFSYSKDNPKTFSFDFRQTDEGVEVDDTQNYIGKYMKVNPTLWSFQMEVTSRCNERCIHCYIPHELKLFDLDFEMGIRTIDQFAGMGGVSITFSGGEATLYHKLPDLIRHARKRDLSITLLSNLVSVSQELLGVMREVGMSLVQVSVYSLIEAEHDAITQLPGSLKKTIANIERLIELDIPVQISCPVMQVNYKSYKDVLDWAYKHKIKAYTDFIMMARTDGTTDNLDKRINESQAREMLTDILQVDADYRIMVAEEPKAKLFMDQKDEPICGVGINTLCMVANGDCYPCAGWQGYTVGNLKTNSLNEIWLKSPQLEYLRSIKRGDFPKCQSCPDQNYCAMCMVRNFNETGDIFTVPTHFCDMATLNREVVEAYRAKP